MNLRRRSYLVEKKNSFAENFAAMKDAFKKDDGLKLSWLANMACRIYDAKETNISMKKANSVAEQVFALLFESVGSMTEGIFKISEIRKLGKDVIKDLFKRIKDVESVSEIQSSKGNYNFNPYMHGMANGLILALSILRSEDPKYLEAPKKWSRDKKCIGAHCKVIVSKGNS